MHILDFLKCYDNAATAVGVTCQNLNFKRADTALYGVLRREYPLYLSGDSGGF